MPKSPVTYRSTRADAGAWSFADALLQGLAPDGGLFIPNRVPDLDPSAWRSRDRLAEVAADVLGAWIDVDAADLARLCEDIFSFPIPVVALEGGAWDGVHIVELIHGPTLSFKDVGARTMARLMDRYLRERDEHLTILAATSGDTGSAVADGFAGMDRIRVVLLYPDGQVSPVQERQLIVERPGVHTYAVQGTFDDCQRLVKAAFVDPDLAELSLSSANSINIGRLLPQMIYYVWAVRQLAAETLTVCVPSGNLGNLTAGVLARASGLPIPQFIAAHNANDFFPRFLLSADNEVAMPDRSERTLSNAMDVGVPSNFERLRTLYAPGVLRAFVTGSSHTDASTLAVIESVYRETGYVVCPHTAVGLAAVERYREQHGGSTPIAVLATAHPAKFPEIVKQALGFAPEAPERLARLWRLPERVEPLPASPEAFKERLLAHADLA